jgi:ribosome-interacting GTPase 1
VPANLGPQFKAAEEQYRQAATDEDKLVALEVMLSVIPKHKGTEKMQGDIKRRIAKIKEKLRSVKKGPRRKEQHRIEKEGAGQVVMVGPPNSGKSHLLKSMTRAKPEVAEYPFTTRVPMPGMARWENVQIQLVDMPPLAEEVIQPWYWSLLRTSDGILLVFDLSDDDLLEHAQATISYLESNNIFIDNTGEKDLIQKRVMCAANKVDAPASQVRLELLMDFTENRYETISCSAVTGEGLEMLKSRIFYGLLRKIRVYTHAPGKKPDFRHPFVLDEGTSVIEAAEEIHKEIAKNLKYARVWGKNVFDGQMVPREHVLHDGDIVVFYA